MVRMIRMSIVEEAGVARQRVEERRWVQKETGGCALGLWRVLLVGAVRLRSVVEPGGDDDEVSIIGGDGS